MSTLFQVIPLITLVGVFVMNIVIAIEVYRDAVFLRSLEARRLRVLSPGTWAVACLFGSLLALALYLAVHYSVWARESE